MISADKWNLIRPIFDNAFKSCLHFAMATVNEDGSPHITPIGSLILREDPTGFFFDEYCTKTRANIARNPRVCFLAVNADRSFWVKSLIMGKFSAPPAVRLMGTVKELREAAPDEIAAWQNRVAFAHLTKGYGIMWSRMHSVRDVQFDSFEPMSSGKMTSGLL
jgi:uncharacterized pyridoxamine 5'-phosphate oxidase family protein